MSFEVTLATLPRIQDDIDRLTAAACRAFAGWGNAEAGTSHDPAYFERVLIRTLIKLVPVLYWELETRDAETAELAGPDLETALCDCLGVDFPTFANKIMRSDSYHAVLRGLVAARMAQRPLPPFPSALSGAQDATAASPTVRQRLSAVGCRTLLYKVPLLRRDQLRLALRSFGRVNHWFRPHAEIDAPAVDPALRTALRDHFAKASVDDLPARLQNRARVVFALLAYLLPVETVEALTAHMAWARDMADLCQPKTLVTGYGLLDAGAFPFYAAECAARGTRLVGWQHGGTYGELATPGRAERWERRITDRFVTWGWEDGDPKLFAAPCPRQPLFRRARKPREAPASLLWVSTADSRFNHFIDHTPVGERLHGYFRHQDAILAQLPSDIAARLVLRPNRNDFGWGLKEMWARRLDTPVFSPEGSQILDEADRCGLVLIDYPGSTAFLECLAAGIPFIAIFDPGVYQIRPSQAAAFRGLEQAGVVHTSPETAAGEIARALDDPEAWQIQPARRKALEDMRALAMRRDPGYIRTWLRLIT